MFGYLLVAQLLINKNSEDPEDPRSMRVLREILCDLAILALAVGVCIEVDFP